MTERLNFARAAAILLGVVTMAGASAQAQTSQSAPSALQGFSTNRNDPVQIEADTLELRDKDKIATFTGNVQVTQGDTQLKARQLVVHYDGTGADAQPGAQGQIRRLEARGNVAVRQKDQVATGEAATFDMRQNTVTISGNVTLTQGRNVLKGDRVVVDLKSGVSRIESGASGGPQRVQGLFVPGQSQRN
jgi:lipopolysaccharide export system protein LptA